MLSHLQSAEDAAAANDVGNKANVFGATTVIQTVSSPLADYLRRRNCLPYFVLEDFIAQNSSELYIVAGEIVYLLDWEAIVATDDLLVQLVILWCYFCDMFLIPNTSFGIHNCVFNYVNRIYFFNMERKKGFVSINHVALLP